MIKTNVYLYQYKDILLDIKDFFSNYRLNKLDDNTKENIQTEYVIKISLEHYINKKIDRLNFTTTKMGKPVLDFENVYLNISHSNKYLVVVISNDEVSIDLEQINEKYLKVSKKVTDDYQNLTINEFIKMWTIKESYLKYFGKSILSNLKKVTLNSSIVSGPNGTLKYQTKRYLDYYLTIALKDSSNISYYCLKDLKSIDEFNIINKSFEEEE